MKKHRLKYLFLILAGLCIFAYSWLVAALRKVEFSVLYFSSSEMVIFTMLIALGLYHYWRWQDGRVA